MRNENVLSDPVRFFLVEVCTIEQHPRSIGMPVDTWPQALKVAADLAAMLIVKRGCCVVVSVKRYEPEGVTEVVAPRLFDEKGELLLAATT